MKVNYQATDKMMVWGKYSLMDANVLALPSLGAANGAGIGGDAGTGHTFQQLATIGSTYVLSPNMVLDANRWLYTNEPVCARERLREKLRHR